MKVQSCVVSSCRNPKLTDPPSRPRGAAPPIPLACSMLVFHQTVTLLFHDSHSSGHVNSASNLLMSRYFF
jgi:hypothetical protein